MPQQSVADIRRRIHDILEEGTGGSTAGAVLARGLLVLIVINLVAIALESVPAYAAQYGFWFDALEYVSLVIFTIEYALRVWTAGEHALARHMPPTRARLAYVFSLRSRRSGSRCSCRTVYASCWCFASCAFSRSRAIRRRCARCSTCSTASGARCSAA